jgi:hypothetical protein
MYGWRSTGIVHRRISRPAARFAWIVGVFAVRDDTARRGRCRRRVRLSTSMLPVDAPMKILMPHAARFQARIASRLSLVAPK